jgi:hypothetical protein
MLDARRPFGWLFLLLPLLVASAVTAQTLPTTTISDTVYRADGTPAGGTLLISWPEFTTAALGAVAAGNTSVTLGIGGSLSVGLVSNANATPANTIYTVVYQLDDGTVKTEYWVVPTTSPTTISAVRTTLGAGSSASQMATQQYVNAALANKANDVAVVHLSGTETIVGEKQFTVAPALPTPVNPTDAANKLYVDNATQNVGNGSYVSTAGGTMTGPLTLSGDPTAPGQAATKRYADVGLSGKADLDAGLVPSGELGTGTANNTLCLHGDSTWGGCGSSSNAVSIQSVPVATTTPTNNQVMTYVASLGEYAPEAGGGVTAGMQAVKYATDFSWSQSPGANLGTTGSQTVNLAVCAGGVTGTEPWYYVYISGTGSAEAVLVTGGTCAGNGQAGTLQFTTLNAHPAGYTISSASGGLQEALIAARFVASNPGGPSQSGKVIVPPGELQAYARVSVRASNVTVDFSGSIVDCYMSDTCIFAGDPSNPNAFIDVTLLNPRGRPMVIGGQSPFIEVNGQKTRLLNLTLRIPPTGGTFSSYVQVDNDQSFLLDGLDTSLATGSTDYGVLCNASVCNPVVYAPGPFSTNAAVGWLKNMNISMQCTGNGVDWQSGNTVKISDSVIEGFAQYGVRAGIKRGGYGGFELDNVYEEVGSCTNPAGAIGEAGVIAQGATVKVEGAVAPVGSIPQFANNGSTDYRYYIVANSATYGDSNPLYAGHALTNGSGNIIVTTPDVAGASTFDLLRVTYLSPNNPREQAPYGTGNYAVATSVTRAAACANGVCTFTDTQAALQSYTVATPAYFPLLDYWPGNLILAANQDSGNVLNAAKAWVQSAPSDIVGVQGMGAPAVISTECQAVDGWTPLWLSCYTSMAPGTFYDQGAFLLAVKPNQDGGLLTNLKGRLNFPTLGTGPGHIITLSDSNFQKTIATANNRPSNDANDAFIGYDQGNGNPSTVGISLGAPVSISNYIGNVGDGTNFLERLTSGLKEFRTNVQLDNALTVAGTAQASSLLTTGAGSWAVEGSYGTLGPALTGKSAIGFGATGKLQVSENGGAVVEVAKLDSNGDVSENANTATQLAQAPSQCNGSFATGVQANGNANCSVADEIQLAEKVELGGALVIQHGDVMFSAASTGVLGGLYPAAVSIAACLAGFQITPNGSQSNIQALVNGASSGTPITTIAGHHYLLTTRLYSPEIYRRLQIFHSSVHPAGSGFGGAEVVADVRVVLELQNIDPTNPATLVAPPTVLYDGVIPGAPDFCTCALANSANLQCAIAFTRLIQAVDAEVRSALPGQGYITQLVGSLEEGAECEITSSSALEFYPQYAPAANQLIEVHYRSLGPALARVTNPASIAAQERGIDNGLHGAVRHPKEPPARTAADCEMAALALLDDATGLAWTGEYDVWSDYLPGSASDIFPGDALNIAVPSRGATFTAIVSDVEIALTNWKDEHLGYKIKFANDAAKAMAFEFETAKATTPLFVTQLTNTQIGTTHLADLTAAVITAVSSTTVSLDAGVAPPSGGGIEVRWSDAGWGPGNDRNLVGRFTTQTFVIPRLARVQNCYLQQYDGSIPPKYSRYTAALHLDNYPL